MTHYEDLVGDLTLDEQAALTAGEDEWHTTGLPSRGIPRIKVTDGPVGARGESYTTTTSALFPCGSALGATFDPELVARVGAAIAADARTKGAHVLLGPTLNLVRHPLGGRNFESYGEDPLLVGRLAVGFVQGLQAHGVGACPKHFVCNDVELERHTISADVDERTLREVYLWPFEAAVRDGGAWTIMASYNRINGTFGCEHPWLLTTVLQEEWGFDGLVMSDWFATQSTVAAALAGLHLEMPGPPHHLGPKLATAVRAGEVPAEVVAEQARRVLRLADRVQATVEEPPERSELDPTHWELAREVAAAAMVLLRNEPVGGRRVLPLDGGQLRRVAVLGPNAAVAVVQGGGSARVTPHRTVTPLAALQARLGEGAEVVHVQGARRAELPALDGRYASAGGTPGIHVAYSAAPGEPVLFANVVPALDAVWSGRFARNVDPYHFHVEASATLQPSTSGDHELSITAVGPCQVLVDGKVVLDTTGAPRGRSFFGFGTEELRTLVPLDAGRSYDFRVRYTRPPGAPNAGVRVGFQPPLGDDPLGAAAEAAARADVAVVVVGTDGVEETEGHDRRTMSLSPEQDELVRRVVAANPRTVVVVNSGSAVDMPWADEVPAILQLWFPGMAGGEALARVLLGDDEPGGRLPFTVPMSLADAPCDISRGDPPGHLRYTEGLAVGHRWYLATGRTPRWWFGQGQGYTRFEWGAPQATVTTAGDVSVEVPVTNVGERPGAEVVQVYLRRPASAVDRPPWILAGVARRRLAPGEQATVRVDLERRALRHWDPVAGWVVEPGPAELRVARFAADPGQTVTVELGGGG